MHWRARALVSFGAVAFLAGPIAASSDSSVPVETVAASGESQTPQRSTGDAAYATYDPASQVGTISTVGAEGPSRTISRDAATLYLDVEWSPDGTAIAASGGSGPSTDLFLVDPATGERTLLVPGDGSAITNLAWGPGSAELAFARRDADGRSTIEVVKRDGSSLRVLARPGDYTVTRDFGCHSTKSAVSLVPYEWSPDGAELLAGAAEPCGEYVFADVVVVDGAGESIRQLTDTGSAEVLARWSPDGSRVAFEMETGVAVAERNGDWYAVGPGLFPTWLDADNLAFVRASDSRREATYDVYVAPARGDAKAHRVGSTDHRVDAPQISPGGSTAWFLSITDAGAQLHSADLATGAQTLRSLTSEQVSSFDVISSTGSAS